MDEQNSLASASETSLVRPVAVAMRVAEVPPQKSVDNIENRTTNTKEGMAMFDRASSERVLAP